MAERTSGAQSTTTVGDAIEQLVRHGDRSRFWFGLALIAGLLVSVSYLSTHPYPAYGAGLYLQIAEEIRAGGYALPTVIPYYTQGGVPFAYPPLMFYVAAVLGELGVAPLTISRLVPATVTVLYLIPYYAVAGELLETRRRAGLATLFLAVCPPALQWHLSAGGMVRAPAFLFSLCGIYAGVRLFKRGDQLWVIPGLVLFGLTVLTHPVYTVFFGLSWLLLFLTFDRTPRGLVSGAVVALGGILLAAPWWLQVIHVHGPDVFLSAAGTHNGLGGGVGRLLDQFVYPLDENYVTLFFVGIFLGTSYFLRRRRFFLPAWLLAGAYFIGKSRFQFVAGSMMLAVFLVEAVGPWVARQVGTRDLRRVTTGVVLLAVVAATVVGGLYAGSALNTAHHGSTSQPAFIDTADREAMTWAAEHTDPGDDFVVAGDAAEWFPLFTDRSILIGPWGVEWTEPAEYERQLRLFRSVSTCEQAACLTATFEQAGVTPDYVYVPRDEYTVRGLTHRPQPGLERSLVDSDRYRLVYGNEGVAIFRVDAQN